MLEITKYIKDLLFLHDCVILPDFGGFIANYRSASIDESKNIFLPPTKDISFNRNLKQNDGLLIHRLIEAEKMSYEEAQKSIAFFVEDLEVRLHRGEKVELEGVGHFSFDKRYNLQFEPGCEVNFLVDALGMGSFSLPQINTFEVAREKHAKFDFSQLRNRITPRVLRYAAVGIPAIVMLTLLPLSTDRDGGLQYSSMSPVEVVKESSPSNTQIKKAEISAPSELVRYEPEVRNVEPVVRNRYYLIAGSFASLDNARVLKQELQRRNYPAEIIQNKKLFSVAVNSFESRTATLKFKRKVIADNPKASCWILKK
ncbi:MAG: SPOR domain-containing protein [Marinifilaceae bacterium]